MWQLARRAGLYGVLLCVVAVTVNVLLWFSRPHQPLYDKLVDISRQATLPPPSGRDHWSSLDLSAQVCPLVNRDLLEDMVRQVRDPLALKSLQPTGETELYLVNAPIDWTICFHRDDNRTLSIALDTTTMQCQAAAQIAPTCDL